MSKFAGRRAVVTGGARGIGAAIVRALAAGGARVAILDRDEAAASATAAGLDGAIAVGCDVSDRAAVEAAFARVEAELGGLDILVNNAARHTLEFNVPVTRLSEDKWHNMIGVNMMGVVNCATVATPLLARSGKGVILNTGSISGFSVNTAYGVTKLAVRGLTVALAEELAPHGIRVNSVAPGLVLTDTIRADLPVDQASAFVQQLQLIKREATTDDLIGAVELFCSDAGSFITGETLIVGGGVSRRV